MPFDAYILKEFWREIGSRGALQKRLERPCKAIKLLNTETIVCRSQTSNWTRTIQITCQRKLAWQSDYVILHDEGENGFLCTNRPNNVFVLFQGERGYVGEKGEQVGLSLMVFYLFINLCINIFNVLLLLFIYLWAVYKADASDWCDYFVV